MSTAHDDTKPTTWVHPRAAEIVAAAFAMRRPPAAAVEDNRDRLNRPRRVNRDERRAA